MGTIYKNGILYTGGSGGEGGECKDYSMDWDASTNSLTLSDGGGAAVQTLQLSNVLTYYHYPVTDIAVNVPWGDIFGSNMQSYQLPTGKTYENIKTAMFMVTSSGVAAALMLNKDGWTLSRGTAETISGTLILGIA